MKIKTSKMDVINWLLKCDGLTEDEVDLTYFLQAVQDSLWRHCALYVNKQKRYAIITRRMTVLKLRMQGYTHRAISVELGMPRPIVYQLLNYIQAEIHTFDRHKDYRSRFVIGWENSYRV